MPLPPRDKPMAVEHLEDRTTPTATVTASVLNADPSSYVAGQVLFSIEPGADRNQTLMALATSPWASTAQELGFGVFKLTLRPGVTVRQALEGLNGNGQLGFVEPDFYQHKEVAPNDPLEQNGTLYAHNNTGQNGGTPGADISAYKGWNQGRGTGQHVVAVLDSGTDYTHQDLADNIWLNEGEIPAAVRSQLVDADGDGRITFRDLNAPANAGRVADNNGNGRIDAGDILRPTAQGGWMDGADTDGNGYVDDFVGYDFVNGDNDPKSGPGDEHGTHVAGIVGAVGNNGIGGVGVAWNTRIMILDFLETGGGALSQEVSAMAYAVRNGASILQGSFGSYPGSPAATFSDRLAIDGATAAGVVCVFSAGNNGTDNDFDPHDPSDISSINPRVVAVAATDRNDRLANFSNYGATTVTLGAPGVDIVSTWPGDQYMSEQGTSMATPQVSGALAVVWDAYPSLTPDELVTLLKSSTDPLADLQGKSVTGGRLDLAKMFQNATFGGYAVGADAGGNPLVEVFAPDGTLRTSFYAFDTRFRGGVRIAMADVNGDRVPDIIAVPGAGGGPNVRVFDGRTLNLLYSFQAYPETFTAGLYVAAGDLDGDGRAELITGAGEGGGPNVRVYKLGDNGAISLVNSFYAYTDRFTGGVRVAVGDYNGDGVKDIVTSPGYGGGPHIKVFDGTVATSGQADILTQFMAGDPRANVGAYVALGNITSDGIADFIVGSGGGDREVRVYDGRTLAFQSGFTVQQPGTTTPLVTSTTITPPPTVGALLGGATTPTQLPVEKAAAVAAESGPSAGLRVAVLDLNNDGVDDIIAAGGAGDQSVVRVRNGQSMTPLYADRTVFANSFLGGVFVAASR